MAIESLRALTASIMVLGRMYVKIGPTAAASKSWSGNCLTCTPRQWAAFSAHLKEKYRTEEMGCQAVIVKAAEILDEIVERGAKDASGNTDAEGASV